MGEAPRGQGDDVKADGPWPRVLLQVVLGHLSVALLLAVGDEALGMAKAAVCAPFDFYKKQQGAFAGDEVYLVAPMAVALRTDGEALALQVRGGAGFCALALLLGGRLRAHGGVGLWASWQCIGDVCYAAQAGINSAHQPFFALAASAASCSWLACD